MESVNYAYEIDREKMSAFIKQLKEKENPDIEAIILRYSSYVPEMAEAALHAAVERGILDYNIKGLLQEQMKKNFLTGLSFAKQQRWEESNAFTGYFERYTDDEIYNIIEDPNNITIDAFHGLLEQALKRELITGEDFNRLYEGGLLATKDPEEIYKEEQRDIEEIFFPGPETIIEEDGTESTYYPSTSQNRFGITMIGVGSLIIFLSWLRPQLISWRSYNWLGFAIGGGAIILGLYMLLSRKDKDATV
jgi:hypothetical protein